MALPPSILLLVLVAGAGLEPASAEYESTMLPLHHPALIVADASPCYFLHIQRGNAVFELQFLYLCVVYLNHLYTNHNLLYVRIHPEEVRVEGAHGDLYWDLHSVHPGAEKLSSVSLDDLCPQ